MKVFEHVQFIVKIVRAIQECFVISMKFPMHPRRQSRLRQQSSLNHRSSFAMVVEITHTVHKPPLISHFN